MDSNKDHDLIRQVYQPGRLYTVCNLEPCVFCRDTIHWCKES